MKTTVKKYFGLLIVAAISFGISGLHSCTEDLVKDEVYIEFNKDFLLFDRYGGEQAVDVVSNRSDLEVSLMTGTGWCDIAYQEGRITVTTQMNDTYNERLAIIKIEGGGFLQTFSVVQTGRNTDLSGIQTSKQVRPSSYTGSNRLGAAYVLDNAFDGDYSTVYVSRLVPAYVSVKFENAARIDYIVVYNVPDEIGYGKLGEFTLSVAKGDSALAEYESYDFNQEGGIRVINFDPPLINPTEIRFDCQSGYTDRAGFCDLEFYYNDTELFDYTTIFADNLCTTLQSGVTMAQIENIPVPFYKELATDIFNGIYNKEFRIQEYKAWQHPSYMAAVNKSRPYSLRDNPTGIYVLSGEELVFFAGSELNGVSVFIQHPNKMINGTSFAVTPGLNKVTAPHDGLVYVLYHTLGDPDKLAPVKINFATGAVNGYFDVNKHKAEDWDRLINYASYRQFDLVGNYAHLTFQTEMFRQHTKDGLELIKAYDDMVYKQQEFMGLVKYNKMYRNRMYFVVMENSNYMHASNNYTGYDIGTQAEILDLNKFRTSSIWGPAHEVGHMNQLTPNLKWHGMTEVTNNILSLHTQTGLGNTSRLMAENTYAEARETIINQENIHNAAISVFCKLVPFWQLKLYMIDVLGKEDFYKDLCEALRTRNEQYGPYAQMQFVRMACDIAELDLTDFFEKWGFLRAGSSSFSDYTANPVEFKVTEDMVQAAKDYIASKNYPLPPHDNIEMITDENIEEFKSTL